MPDGSKQQRGVYVYLTDLDGNPSHMPPGVSFDIGATESARKVFQEFVTQIETDGYKGANAIKSAGNDGFTTIQTQSGQIEDYTETAQFLWEKFLATLKNTPHHVLLGQVQHTSA